VRLLAKESTARSARMSYRVGGHNDELLNALIADQHGFCAYSEQRVDALDTCAVEHFDATMKGKPEDGPFNHYGVQQKVNQRKRRRTKPFTDAWFFADRSWQVPGAFAARVRFVVEDNAFDAVNPDDQATLDLLDYLGVNGYEVCEVRRTHLRGLKDTFELGGLDEAGRLAWLRDHPEDLSFPSALAATFGLDLDHLSELARQLVS
jgi:hypothetical protein